ncbi:MAG: fibronectin type III domain-containing protein [Sphingobacteriales bacterium]|nr:fibronectin type III domain-containing protein [Sphingobacteriales bacterium]
MRNIYVKLLMGLVFVFGVVGVNGQSTVNYTFATNTTGSLGFDMNSNAVDMSTGTTTLVGAGLDDTQSGLTNFNLGAGSTFEFYLMGVKYTQFAASDNGVIGIGALPGTTVYALPNTTVPTIAAFANDMRTGSDGKVEAKIVGTAPNRTLVIQWTNNMIRFAAAAPGTGTWQVRLYESTGVIEFVYGTMTTNAALPTVYYVGFSTNITVNNVVTLNTSTNVATTSATVVSNSYTASSTITNLNSAADGSRRVYKFTPPGSSGHATISSLAAPTALNFTAVTPAGMTVNWTAASPTTGIIKYAVYYSTDGGTTYTYVNTTLLGTNTLVVTGLVPSTTYSWKVVSVSEGGLSAALTGTQATAPPVTYYWVGTATAEFNTAATWNTAADGTGTTRTAAFASDILIIDGAGTVAGAAITGGTINANSSIGILKFTNSTSVVLTGVTSTRTITIAGGVGDDLDIQAGSTLTLNGATAVAIVFSGTNSTGNISGTLTLGGGTANAITTTGGTGTVVTVTSTGIINNGVTAASGNVTGSAATLIFANGSNYNVSGATTGAPAIPLATWGASSNITITGLTTSTTAPTNNAQTFGNLTYNCTASTGTMSFWATTSTAVVQGNLTIQATNTGKFRMVTTGTVNITGNLIISAGTCEISSSTGTVIVAGGLTQTGGRLDISSGTGAANLKVAGTVNQSAGDILVSAATTATDNFEFNGASSQNLTFSGTISGPVNFKVNNTAGINLTGTMRINVGAALTVSNGNITGSGTVVYNNTNNYTSSAGATSATTTITVASTLGLVTGMTVTVTAGTGTFAAATTVSSITNATTFVVTATPTVALSGGATVVSGTITGNSKLVYNSTNTAQTANSVEFPAANGPSSLTINNTFAAPNNTVTIPFSRTMTGTAGVLTLTAGILDNSSYVLTLSNTATAAVSGGSTTSFVKGAIERSLPASWVSGTTYIFPVGKGTYNPLAMVNPTTNAGGAVTVKAEVFDANAGGTAGSNMGTLNTDRYWASSITSGAANFTNTFIQLNDISAISSTAIASSATLTGAYDIVGGVSPTVVVGTSVLSVAPAATTIPGFFVLGTKSVSMSYVSSTTTQAVTSVILKPATNQQIIGIQIVTVGNASPLTLQNLYFNTTGSTVPATDIATARVWYTGTSATYAATTQFGSDMTAPSGSFTVNGSQALLEGTNYFWMVYDVPAGAVINNVVDGECTQVDYGTTQIPTATAPAGTRTIKSMLNGTYNIGSGGNYTSLTKVDGLFADINAYGLSGNVTIQVISDLTEDGVTALNQWTESGSGNYTLTIQPDATTLRTISATAVATGIPMININGADRVTIDGGAGKYLTFRNTNAAAASTGASIQFTNGSGTCTLTNCTIEYNGSSATRASVIIGSTGTNAVTISNNDLRDATAGTVGVPTNAVYSNSATNTITVSGNNIYNWTGTGILFTNVANGCTISGNSIYQTASRSTAMTAISIQAGSGHAVLNNFIGGTAANAGSTNMTTSSSFTGISLSVGIVSSTSVQGNVIKNIRSTLSASYVASYGIYLAAGMANIGDISGNTVGSSNSAERVEISGDCYAMRFISTSTVNVSNNVINNFNTATGVPTGEYYTGMSIEGTGGVFSVINNSISNVNNGSTTDATYNTQTIGLIVSATGIQTIRGNSIHDVGSSSIVAPTSNNNKIFGLVLSATATGTVVEKNSIYRIYGSSSGATARADIIALLQTQSLANATYSNNMITGADLSGSSARVYYGINDLNAAPTISNYFYNSVSISGTGTSTNSTWVFNRNGTATVTLKNNIFSNARTGGTGYHVAIANTNASATGWSATAANYNVLYSATSTTVAQWLGTAVGNNRTLATWQAAQASGSGGDANSVSVLPNFIDASTGNLHLIANTNCSLDGTGNNTGIAMVNDIDGDSRGATTTDIGADEFTSTFSASAGTAQSVCGTSVTMAASLSNGTGTWMPTAGLTYTPDNTTATASVSGLTSSNSGTANVFTWTITGAGSCNTALPVTITAFTPPTVNAGIDQTVCSTSPNITLAASKGGSASTVTWTTSGTGAFDDASSLTAVYTLSAADITAGMVTLTLTTDDPTGPCGSVNDAMAITISTGATANANSDQSVCAGSPDVTLAGSIGGSATTATWTGGTGTFNPDNTSLTAVYTPSAAEITAGTVTLTLTTDDPAGVCAAATDQMVITIRPSATANAGTDQSVCVSSPSVTLNGSIGGSALSGTWSGGIGTFTPDNTTLNAVYTPAAGENAAGMVITLTLTTTGPCAVTTDDMLISIHGNPDAPTGSATQTFCAAGTIADLSATGTSIQWYAAATGGSAISSGTALVDGTTYYASQTVGVCESVTRLAVTVTLNPAATANAGTPQSICAGNTVTLAGTIGGGASSATWSGGLGTFSPNATTLDAVYTPTAGEITAGAVTLTLTTDNPAGPCGAVTSNMTITISTNSGSLVSSAIPVCKTMSVGTGAVYTSGACDIIDKVVPNGASPVNGVINSCVTIDATVQSYNSEPYLQRHFDITPSTNPLTSSARITLYVLQSEFDDFNLANSTYPDLPTGPSDAAGIGNLRITKYSGTGTAPGNYTPGVETLLDPDDVDIVWNGSYWEISFDITGFSGFYIHTGYGNPLPLNLLNFGGYKDGSVNQLRWSTANEINSRGFEVQRSVDGIHYSAIGFVNSVGQNGTTNNYVYTDRAVVGDRQYYRLRQVDLDGHSKLSNIVLIRGDKLNVLQVQGLYPNPATSQINLLLSSPIQEKMQLQLMDITGRTVVQRWISVETGSNNIPVNISMLSSGSYLVKLLGASSQETIVAKFVKQ